MIVKINIINIDKRELVETSLSLGFKNITQFMRHCLLQELKKHSQKKISKNLKKELITDENIKRGIRIKRIYKSQMWLNSLMFYPYNQSMRVKRVLIARTFNKHYADCLTNDWKEYLINIPESPTKKIVRTMLNEIKKDVFKLACDNPHRLERLGQIMQEHYPDGIKHSDKRKMIE